MPGPGCVELRRRSPFWRTTLRRFAFGTSHDQGVPTEPSRNTPGYKCFLGVSESWTLQLSLSLPSGFECFLCGAISHASVNQDRSPALESYTKEVLPSRREPNCSMLKDYFKLYKLDHGFERLSPTRKGHFQHLFRCYTLLNDPWILNKSETLSLVVAKSRARGT